MSIIRAEVPSELNSKLISFAKSLDLPKKDLIRKAIEYYLIELQEDEEDYQEVIKRLSQNRKTIPWEEVQRKCGLLAIKYMKTRVPFNPTTYPIT